MAYEQTKQEVHKRQEQDALKKEEKKKAAANRKRNHRKRLKELDKKLGAITHELYNRCMSQLQDNKYNDDGEKNRDRNIVELYGQQQKFSDQIDMDDMDTI